MKRERWRQVEQIYHSTLEREESQRPSFLKEACAGDEVLRREVESLLAHEEQAESFIEVPALEVAAKGLAEGQHQSLIGRQIGSYQILSLLGAGGMGEVYRARDTKLDRIDALKVLPADVASDQDRMRRFIREARAASALKHPNVATIYEIGESVGIHFIAMEYVEGQTLAAKIGGRPLDPAEIVEIGLQVADALDEAHNKGITHRDIKSANLMLTPRGQVKVLDFGLAKVTKPEGQMVTSDISTVLKTETGVVLGTVQYMSPEQVLGHKVDQRTDLFSLGVVLYEMATGRLPFSGATVSETMDRVLHAQPDAIARFNYNVPAELDRIIRKCLEKDRDRRYQSARELLIDLRNLKRDLDSGVAAAVVGSYQRWQRLLRSRRTLVLGGIAVIILLASAVGYYLRVTRQLQNTAIPKVTHFPAGPINVRRSVAVLGFKNLSGRPDVGWLSTALSEMLSTELAAGERLRTIPGENVARMKIELSLAEAESFAKETLARIRTNLGTDLVILGSYLALGEKAGGQIRLDLRLQDAAAGETIISVAETGTEVQLFDLVSRTGARLREKLGVGELSAAEEGGVRAALPLSPEATRLYSEGLQRLRVFDALAARDLLEKAIAADPNYPLAHSALAAAWSALGYDGKARVEAKLSFDLSANLPREERLSVEGRYREILNDWGKAAEIYQSLFHFFPDNLEYGIRLASAQTSGGRGKDALAAVDMLRRFPQPAADDPRIDLAEAMAVGSLSNFKKEQELEAKAAHKGAALGAQLLVARARLLESRALRNLGLPERARAAAQEARDIFSKAKYLEGVARATNNLATLQSDQGNIDQAARLHEESLAISRRIGDQGGVASAYNNLAICSKDQGNLAEALKLHQQALAIRQEIDDKSGIAVSLNNLAVVLYGQDDLSGATKRYEESLALAREIGERRAIVRAQSNLSLVLRDRGELAAARKMQEESMVIRQQIGDKNGIALAQLNLGQLLLDQGDLAGARRLVEQAIQVEREVNRRRGIAYDLSALGEIALAEGNLAAARKHHEEALKMREQSGEKGTASESRLALASLAIEEGRPAEGEALARAVAKEFALQKARQHETEAYLVLTRAQLAQKKPAEAQSSLNQALALIRGSERRYLSLSVDLTTARVRAALSKITTAEAQKLLAQVSDSAVKTGYPALQLETRLAAAEIGLRSGNASAALRELAALQRDAAARGFGLIAQKAARLAAAYR